MPQGCQAGTGQAGALPHQAQSEQGPPPAGSVVSQQYGPAVQLLWPAAEAVAPASAHLDRHLHLRPKASGRTESRGAPSNSQRYTSIESNLVQPYKIVQGYRKVLLLRSAERIATQIFSSRRATRIATQRESRPRVQRAPDRRLGGAVPSSALALFSLSQQQFPAAQNRRSQRRLCFTEVSRH